MRGLRNLALALLLAIPFACTAKAQVSVGVGLGPVVVPAPVVYGPPACDWGYYPYYPYACAPYGYYGPTWFTGGVFIGAGPWYHWGYRHPGWGRERMAYGGRPAYEGRGDFEGRGGYDGRHAPGFAPSGRGFGNSNPGNSFRGGFTFHGNAGFSHGGGGFGHGGGHR